MIGIRSTIMIRPLMSKEQAREAQGVRYAVADGLDEPGLREQRPERYAASEEDALAARQVSCTCPRSYALTHAPASRKLVLGDAHSRREV